MFDQIEKLKQDFTDKYVVVDASVPELRRFEGHVGQVKTVNMSGRALVEFDAWSNIGWYDIELDYLKIVAKPQAPSDAKKHEAAAKPAAKPVDKPAAAPGAKKLSPLEMARMQGAAKGAATAPPGEKAVPPGGAKKSTADILAAARAKQSAEPAAAVAPAVAAREAAEPQSAPAAQSPEAAAPAAEVRPKTAPSKPALAPGQRPSIPEILAWCREHDAK